MSQAPESQQRPRRSRLGAHLVLVGLPGAGKTTVGALVGASLAVPFLDFDQEIERREGLPVSEIFAVRGEPYFRRLERELTAEVRRKPPSILAPGGGWITNPDNVALLRPPARIIHLRVMAETALARLGPLAGRRPLLAGDQPLTRLAALWKERSPSYALADAEIDTQALVPQEVANKVSELARAWGWPVG